MSCDSVIMAFSRRPNHGKYTKSDILGKCICDSATLTRWQHLKCVQFWQSRTSVKQLERRCRALHCLFCVCCCMHWLKLCVPLIFWTTNCWHPLDCLHRCWDFAFFVLVCFLFVFLNYTSTICVQWKLLVFTVSIPVWPCQQRRHHNDCTRFLAVQFSVWFHVIA